MKTHSSSPYFPYKPSPSMEHGQTVRNGRLINTGCCEKTGIQKLIDMKKSMKRAEKISVMSEAMIIAERVSDQMEGPE